MHLLLISPYHGGSHQAWGEGYRQFSEHEVQILSLPARFWKWRMHGGAITLARRFLESDWQPEGIIATDMLDLTTFLALTRHRTAGVPSILYMHENQLTYPLPANPSEGAMRRQKGERDLHYPFINLASMAAADEIWFNSAYHQADWFAALPNFLKHYPEQNELELVDELAAKCRVAAVGVDLSRLDPPIVSDLEQPPLILWNQRWEYDKNPAAFFESLFHLQDAGIPFRLALCGQNFRVNPAEFDVGIKRLESAIVHVGFASPDQYRTLLWEAEFVVSTAAHEFFGIGVVEALYCRAFPLLPNRLSYPDLLPAAVHTQCLYETCDNLTDKLRWAMANRDQCRQIAGKLAAHCTVYDWQNVAPSYDRWAANLAFKAPTAKSERLPADL